MTSGNGNKSGWPGFLLDQSVSSTGQSGGITAHTVNMGPPRRNLSDPQAGDLKRALLALSKDKPVHITFLAGDIDASEFGEQLLTFFEQNGYSVSIAGLMMGAPFEGLNLNSNEDGHYLRVGANV